MLNCVSSLSGADRCWDHERFLSPVEEVHASTRNAAGATSTARGETTTSVAVNEAMDASACVLHTERQPSTLSVLDQSVFLLEH